MAAIALRVYDTDLTTLLGTLDQPYGIAWSRERLDVGAGQFTIPHDAPIVQTTPAVLARERLVVVSVDNVDTFAWIIRRKQRVRGDVWDPIQVTGPGALELLRLALVYQRDGVNSLVPSDDRLFGWMTRDFDDGTTGEAPGWAKVDGTKIGGPLSTEGFTEGTVAFHAYFEGKRSLYRRLLLAVPGAAGPARMLLAAKHGTEVIVYLDGEEVLRKDAEDSGLHAADIPYREYDMQLAVEVSGGTGRWGWEWRQLVETEGDGGSFEYGSSIRRTYDPADYPDATPWLSYEGDIPYPGVTPGFILSSLMDEARARGFLPAITYDFNADVDSAGERWPRIGDWSTAPGKLEFACQVGDDSVLSVAERLRDYGVDVALGPDLVFHAWQGRGQDRSGTVAIGLGEAYDLSTETEDDTYNALLIRTQRAWFERSLAVIDNRREAFLSLGMTPTVAGGVEVADRVLDDFNRPRQVIRFTMAEGLGPAPGVAFHLGDVVSAPTVDPQNIAGPWSLGPLRIDTLAASIGDTGQPTWVVEASPPRP